MSTMMHWRGVSSAVVPSSGDSAHVRASMYEDKTRQVEAAQACLGPTQRREAA